MRVLLALLLLFGFPSVVWAQTSTGDNPADQPKSFWEQDKLLGDLGGLRGKLEAAGIDLEFQETDEGWSSLQGGLHHGTTYDGQLQATLSVDTAKAFGWEGGTFTVSAFQIRGVQPARVLVGNLQTISNIEATPAIRLFDLWYEQQLAGDQLSIRLGQMAVDEEFMISSSSQLFLNPGSGLPALAAVDLPSGGPAYPLATPGARLKFKATEALTLLGAVFNGNPAGPGTGDPQVRDASGTEFRLRDGVLAIVEAQYAINQGEDAAGLPGTYRLGAWLQSQRFADQRFASNGVSLASPLSSGTPASHSGDYAGYAIADQMIWRPAGSKDAGISLYARIMAAPSDRNLADLYLNGGITWKGIVPGRGDDTAGIAVGYLRIGDQARGLDADTALFSGNPYPIRSNETVIEATYQAQVAGWWQLQPDLQYVLRPGGNVPDPTAPGHTLKSAVVIGLRSVISF